jgi:alpha-L-fucosidase
MMLRKIVLALSGGLSILVLLGRAQVEPSRQQVKVDADYQHASPEAYEKWRDHKFGMRIHWGPYSVLGLDASWPTLNASPEFKVIYNTLYQVFNPVNFDADRWAELAEQAGFKYFVFTTKHHDGFCMFDTKTKVRAFRRTPEGKRSGIGKYEECEIAYSIMDTPYRRDIVAQLVQAFRKRGFGVSFYYSNVDWLDWNQRFNKQSMFYDLSYTIRSDPEGYQKAIERQTEQLRELATNYGPIDEFSFDAELPDELWPGTVKMVKMVRRLQPDALFRERGIGPYGDFTTPEHWIPEGPDDPRLTLPWEAIEPLGTRWAYQPNDTYKPKEWILRTLIDTSYKGGNFMVGVSPMANGEFPPETAQRLLWAGKWLKVNGEAIYGTRGLFIKTSNERLKFTRSKDNKYAYAIFEGWPGRSVRISGIEARPGTAITMLGVNQKLRWRQDRDAILVEVPESIERNRPCEFAYVFKIECKAALKH